MAKPIILYRGFQGHSEYPQLNGDEASFDPFPEDTLAFRERCKDYLHQGEYAILRYDPLRSAALLFKRPEDAIGHRTTHS